MVKAACGSYDCNLLAMQREFLSTDSQSLVQTFVVRQQFVLKDPGSLKTSIKLKAFLFIIYFPLPFSLLI